MNNSIKEIKKKLMQIISLLFVSMLLISFTAVNSKTLSGKTEKSFLETGNLLYKSGVPTLSSMGGEWVILGLSRGDYSADSSFYEEYYKNVVETVKAKKGVLSKNKYTEYSRVIIALTSIGKDVRSVGGYNLLNYLGDFNKVKLQGINGPIWALIALDCGGYEVPVAGALEQTTREKLINYILSAEIKTGGWALGGDVPDADITSMAITSLAKYYNHNESVKEAVDRGVKVLSEMQNSNGAFTFNKIDSCESVVQAITCLSSLGINPDTDSRFIKNGKSLVDSLLDFSVKGGGFSHIKGGEYNQLSTEQGYYSLVAYNRLLDGKKELFDMTDKVIPEVTFPVITVTTTASNTEKTTNTYTSTTVEKNSTSSSTVITTEGSSFTKSKNTTVSISSTDNTDFSKVIYEENTNAPEIITDISDITEEQSTEITITSTSTVVENSTTVTNTTTPNLFTENSAETTEVNENNYTLIIVASCITSAMIVVLIVLIALIIKRKAKRK